MADFPTLDEVMRRAQAAQAPQPQANSGFFAPALSAGYHEAVGQLASVGEAAGHALGMPGLEQWAAGHAAQQKKAAVAADNPEYANAAWYSPTGALYHLLRGAPQLAAGAAAAALAPEGAGLLATMGAGALGAAPFVVGQEVQNAKEGNHGQLTGEGLAKAAAIGLPMS